MKNAATKNELLGEVFVERFEKWSDEVNAYTIEKCAVCKDLRRQIYKVKVRQADTKEKQSENRRKRARLNAELVQHQVHILFTFQVFVSCLHSLLYITEK
jgi:hypothetical protein